MNDLWHGCRLLLALSWHQNRRKIGVAVTLMLLGAAATPLTALAARQLMVEVTSGHHASAVAAALATAVLAVAGLTLAHYAHIAYFELSDLNALELDDRLIASVNNGAVLHHQESPRYADTVALLREDIQQIRTALQAVLNIAATALTLTMTVVLLALLHPLLLLLAVLALVPLAAGRRAERIVDRARVAAAEDGRVALSFFRMATAAEPAKELRAFRLRDEVLRRHGALWRAVTHRLRVAQARAAAVRVAGQVAFTGGYVLGLLLVVHGAVADRRTVGDVVLAIVLAAQVNQHVATAVGLLRDLQRSAATFGRLAALKELAAPAGPDRPGAASPPRLRRGIELADVDFGYPGLPGRVLSGVNLFLPAGSTVAIVGENGAGKSTLVKLLCGFYEPTRGQVRVDSVDLRRMSPTAWRERIAVGFQDFVRFELTVAETVGVGDLPRLDEPGAVPGAVAQADATDLVARLPRQLATPLGASFADGTQLSGGQWQRLALARAFMRQDPLLLILDEPASALDAATEHRLFTRYAEQAARLAERTGAITVFVSHRFSTVRMADLIVVLGDGGVREVGDHASLVRSGGTYAELYGIQATAYR